MQSKPNPAEENLSGMLEFLNLQMDNFPAITAFISSNGITSSTLFLSQSLSLVDGELIRNPNFVYQCFEMLDVVSVYSVSLYGDPDVYLDTVIKGIISNRTVPNFESSLGGDVTTHIYFSSSKDFEEFFQNNKFLVAIYLCAVMTTITYKRK